MLQVHCCFSNQIKEDPIESQVTTFGNLTEKFETDMMEVDDDPKLKVCNNNQAIKMSQ